ncbi:MAG: MFS transporter [Oscillospiraceae bacterium]|nr:MFS transporter [Oscillospiraceae bacterium]
MQSALQPSINALASRWNAVSPVDFGSSRGFSSLLYAIMTVCVGLLLKIMPPFFLPTFYLKTMGMLFCILFLTVLPDSARQEEPTADFSSNFRLGSVMNGSFAFLLLGIFCLSVGHIMIDNFMLQIMQSVGGNSENLGIAVSVAALVEFPAMKSYRFLSSRFGNARILVFSAFAWVIKNLLIFLASSPSVICAAETLQFFSYALYTPGIVTYIGEKYPKNEQLCRLSLVGSAYTAGSFASASIGGLLLDFFGVHSALLSIIPITLVGALLFIAAVRRDCPSIECCSTSEKTNR